MQFENISIHCENGQIVEIVTVADIVLMMKLSADTGDV